MKLSQIPAEALIAPQTPTPPFASLLRGAPEAVRHYLMDAPATEAGWMFHKALKLLPPDRVAAIGRAIGSKVAAMEADKPYAKRMRANLDRLRPDLTFEDVHRDWVRNMTQVFCEYAVLGEIGAPERLEVAGQAHMDALLRDQRPFVAVFVHTGHWETLGWYSAKAGLTDKCFSVYQPQGRRLFNRVVAAARAEHGGKVLPPGLATTRRLLALAKAPGQFPCFAIDEVRYGQIQFPLFGRSPPLQGNLVIALHFARKLNAPILPMACERIGPARYRWVIHPPVEVAAAASQPAQIGETAERLEAVYAPWIRDRLTQWYMFGELRL